MSAMDIGRLWWTAMERFGKADRQELLQGEEKRAWLFVFCAAKRILRAIRKSHGLLPKPPCLEELQQEARQHLR